MVRSATLQAIVLLIAVCAFARCPIGVQASLCPDKPLINVLHKWLKASRQIAGTPHCSLGRLWWAPLLSLDRASSRLVTRRDILALI